MVNPNYLRPNNIATIKFPDIGNRETPPRHNVVLTREDLFKNEHFCGVDLNIYWLTKFLFEKMDEATWQKEIGQKIFIIMLDDTNKFNLLYQFPNSHPIPLDCILDHVHQLQNIVFELSGVMLEQTN